MSRKAITDLTAASSVANTDLFVIETGINSVPATKSITANLVYAYVTGRIPGPFANDSVASANGLALKAVYYDSSGIVRVRIV